MNQPSADYELDITLGSVQFIHKEAARFPARLVMETYMYTEDTNAIYIFVVHIYLAPGIVQACIVCRFHAAQTKYVAYPVLVIVAGIPVAEPFASLRILRIVFRFI
jgi:hypothetical protein